MSIGSIISIAFFLIPLAFHILDKSCRNVKYTMRTDLQWMHVVIAWRKTREFFYDEEQLITA